MTASNPRYFGIPPSQQVLLENRYPYTATLGQTTFAATYTIGYVDVYYNGVHLDPRFAFTASDGATIVLTNGAAAGASVVIVARPQVPTSNTYTQGQVNELIEAYAAVVTGTGDAILAATVPTFSSFTDGMQVKVRMGSLTNTTTSPTIAFNGLSAKTIIGNSQIAVPVGAWPINAEVTFRYNMTTGNFVLLGVIAVPTITKRQTVMTGPVDANGAANEIGVGTGLAPVINGSVTPVVATFASGFGFNGNVDTVSTIAGSLSWPAQPVSNLSYLSLDKNNTTGALTLTSSLVPPQYGSTFDKTKQALCHFDGVAGAITTTEDYGNTVSFLNNAKLQSIQSKFGGTALGGTGTANALDGVANAAILTAITSPGSGSWTTEAWVYHTVATANGIFGPSVGLNNVVQYTAGNKLTWSFSSVSNNDIVSATGTTTVAMNTWNHVAATYDSAAGVYRLYLNGVQELSATSALKATWSTSGFLIGATYAGGTQYFNGYIDEFRFSPYCKYPGGTTFTPATTAGTVEGDWFNTQNYTMNQVSAPSTVAGTNPTFTQKQRLYVGEATTGTSTVSSVVSYAYNRYHYRRITNIQATSTRSLYLTNMGTDLVNITVNIINKTGEFGYTPGMKVPFLTGYNSGSYVMLFSPVQIVDRNTSAIITENSSSADLPNPASAPSSRLGATLTNWDTELTVTGTY